MNMKARTTLYLAIGLVFLAALSGPLSGAANVSRSPGQESWSPRIAVDSRGNLHVVWAEYLPGTQNGDAYYSKYDIGDKEWSVPLNMSKTGRVFTEEKRPVGVAVDGNDNVYVIYVEKTRISMKILSGGSWSAPTVVHSWSSGNCDTARIAVDANGNIFTTWWIMDSYRVFSRARIGGKWEDVKTISTGQAKFPDIAVGNNVAFAAWTQRTQVGAEVIYQIFYTKRNKSSGANWDVAKLMYQDSDKQQVPAVEIDSNDVAHIVFTPVLALGGQRVVQYCRWTGSGFAAPQDISSLGLLHYPALDERGNNLYCCWQVGAYGDGAGVRANNRIARSWTGVTAVPDSAGATYCDVAVSPDLGTYYYVWDGGGEVWCNLGQTGEPPDTPPGGYPVASFSFSPTSGAPPLLVSFDGSSSFDSDGSIVSYSWSFGDGTTGSGAIVSHTFRTRGVFTVRLTVTDNEGKQGSSSQTIEVIQANAPPSAQFGFSPGTGIFPVEIAFDGSGSRDSDGSIVQYSWDFGDGGRGSGRVVRHIYNNWGTFSVALTVRDDRGAAANSVRDIEILRLLQPLDIGWQTFKDESLFQTRHVTQVSWSRNPANDGLGIPLQIVLYRVWRKKAGESDFGYKLIGEVNGETYALVDKDGSVADTYVYTVTARDNHGHESPIVGGGGNPLLVQPERNLPAQSRRGRVPIR
jgi:PKD repeat protein